MSLVSFSEQFYKIKVPTGTVTAPYGSIDSVHKTPHSGLDLACNYSEHIYTPLDGVISRIVNQPSGLGRGIFIKLHDGKQMIFGHFSEINPKLTVGKVVHTGDFLGDCGSTGHSTGNHLHFAIKDVDGHYLNPVTYFEAIKSSLSQWTNKLLVINQEARIAFVDDPAIVSLDEKTNTLFKILDVISDVL